MFIYTIMKYATIRAFTYIIYTTIFIAKSLNLVYSYQYTYVRAIIQEWYVI